MPTIHVRFFAASAQAFGTTETHTELSEGATLGDLSAALIAGEVPGTTPSSTAATVLGRCSFLVNKVSTRDLTARLIAADEGAPVRIDVLPPFAGG